MDYETMRQAGYVSEGSRYNEAWRRRNRAKARAHWTVQNAIREGRLTASPCEVCGAIRTHAHHDDYAQPLNVRWLCHAHHEEAHHGIRQPKVRKRDAPGYRKPHPTLPPPPWLPEARRLLATGQSYRRIAATLGVSVGTVYKRLNATAYD